MRSLDQIISGAKKQAEYQKAYQKSPRGKARQRAYNRLHNYENKVGLWIAAGQLPDGTKFSRADGMTAIKLARETYEKAFGELPKNTTVV